MKKSILNLGEALNKAEQKEINGGSPRFCRCDSECGSGSHCCSNRCYNISAPNYPTNNCPPLYCEFIEM
ncbi:hypothetical protein [Tenacibaculum ovolyticum]|uniref:hypothetical protein n=1 Tax=Tenacibaculum ovolyticum TaxID=104270 RepID=UPI001F3E614F|nr:hypothetical protein [Tenacibaculum ovolyticum]